MRRFAKNDPRYDNSAAIKEGVVRRLLFYMACPKRSYIFGRFGRGIYIFKNKLRKSSDKVVARMDEDNV